MLTAMPCSTVDNDDLQLTTDVDGHDSVDSGQCFDTAQPDDASMETGSTEFYFSLSRPVDGRDPCDYEIRPRIYDNLEETLSFRIE